MKPRNIVTLLDIGSSKVCCCIVNIHNDGKFDILGIGYCMCVGVKRGIISDLESVKNSIAKAIEIAEKTANFQVKHVYVNISGKDIKSKIINASINIGGKIIKNEDISYLLSICNGDGDSSEEVIHTVPIMYSIDSLSGIKNPVGMIANKLSINMNIITAPKIQLKNILICLAMCHLEVAGVIATSYASGLCAFDESELQLPYIVIDFGANTTSLAFFYNGVFCGSEIIPLGGAHITNDIAYGLNISYASAERLKTLNGAAFVSIDDERDMVLAPVIEDDNVIDLQQISKSTLNQIIQARVEEILKKIKIRIDESIFKDDFNNCGVVVTGGGSQLTGIRDFSADILNTKIKLKKIISPAFDASSKITNDFSVVIGMIKFVQLSNSKKTGKKTLHDKTQKISFLKKALLWIEKNI